jgi:hypothetical protein
MIVYLFFQRQKVLLHPFLLDYFDEFISTALVKVRHADNRAPLVYLFRPNSQDIDDLIQHIFQIEDIQMFLELIALDQLPVFHFFELVYHQLALGLHDLKFIFKICGVV